MDDRQKPASDETPATPEERAFTGHPDHPPSSPDQTLEGNEELLQRPEDGEGEAGASG
jgi:hypothetical protein